MVKKKKKKKKKKGNELGFTNVQDGTRSLAQSENQAEANCRTGSLRTKRKTGREAEKEKGGFFPASLPVLRLLRRL